MPELSAIEPFLHPGCKIADSAFGAWCEVGRDSRVLAWWDWGHDRLPDFRRLPAEAFLDRYGG